MATEKAGRQSAYLRMSGAEALQDSLRRVYTALGLTGEKERRAFFNSTEAAEKASRWLWIQRTDRGTQVDA